MIKLFFNTVVALTTYFSCQYIYSAPQTSFGDLMLSAQERKQLDALRNNKIVQSNTNKKTSSTKLAPPKKIHINGFYYTRGERSKPIVWIDGEQAKSRQLTPSLNVKGIKQDKQTLIISSQKKARSHAIKAGQSINIIDGTVHEAHEN